MLSIPIVTSYVDDGMKKAIKEFKQLGTVGEKAQFAIKKAAVPAAAAMAGLGAALFDATKGAIEDAAAQDLLANNLRKTTKATDLQIAGTEDWITTQGKLLGFSDSQLRPALSRLAKATGDVQEAQKLASQAMDISTATGKPLETVVGALEKAYGGNLTALARLAPEYRDLVKEGASFEVVMDKLAKTTGGAAAEAANTAAGKMQRLALAVDETKESIGASLLPIVEAALPKLEELAAWAQDNPKAFTNVALAIGAIATATLAVNAAMAVNPYVLAAAGIVGLAIAFERLFTALEKISKVGGIAARIAGAIIGAPGAAGNLVGMGLGAITGGSNTPIGPLPGGTNISPARAPSIATNANRGVMVGGQGGTNITVNAGLLSSPDQVGQQIIEAIQKAQRRSGVVFAPG
jgi:hypothetical protein